MRKMKKINGYLVVRFNDRELREWEGTALGNYGVIDAELYTGTLEVDRSVMEYDDAETLEEAIEKARGLESELDVEEPEVKVTVIKETDDYATEEEVDPQLLIAGWVTALTEQVKSGHHPNVSPMTARHELYGFKVALRELGLLDSGECYVLPDAFGSESSDAAALFAAMKERLTRQITSPRYPDTDERTAAHELYGYVLALQDLGLVKEYDGNFSATLDTFKGIQKAEGRSTFKGLPEDITAEPFALEAARRVYALGLVLSEDCPDNDCRVYLNTFNMARELDAALDTARGYAAEVLRQKLARLFKELREMYVHNHAVKEYKEGMQS